MTSFLPRRSTHSPPGRPSVGHLAPSRINLIDWLDGPQADTAGSIGKMLLSADSQAHENDHQQRKGDQQANQPTRPRTRSEVERPAHPRDRLRNPRSAVSFAEVKPHGPVVGVRPLSIVEFSLIHNGGDPWLAAAGLPIAHDAARESIASRCSPLQGSYSRLSTLFPQASEHRLWLNDLLTFKNLHLVNTILVVVGDLHFDFSS